MSFAMRTSARKAGSTEITLPHEGKVVVMANLLAPDHDRNLWEPTLQWLSQYRPHLIVFAGRIIHARALKLLDPSSSLAEDEDEPPLAPEVELALAKSDIWEERVIEFFRLCGENIFKRIVKAAGPQCQLYYIPALDGGSANNLPAEGLIRRDLERIQKKIDRQRLRQFNEELAAWRRRAREEGEDADGQPEPQQEVYAEIPLLRREFARLLQIDGSPRIKVLPFGSTLTLRCQAGGTADSPVLSTVRIDVGSRKVMNPMTEAHTVTMTNGVSTIMGYPPNLSCGWFTKSANVNAVNRAYMFFAQVGMMWRRERLEFGDTRVERYASGFFLGHNVGGWLHGNIVPFLRGPDGRRAATIFGRVIEESEPGDLGRRDAARIVF
jgi:hypothetical protein